MQQGRNNKILVLTSTLNVGGTEQHLLQVLPQLQSQFEIRLYTTSHPGAMLDKFKQAGIAVISPPGWRWLRRLGRLGRIALMLSSVGKLIQTLASYRPAVLHCYLQGPFLMGATIANFLKHPRVVMSKRREYTNAEKKTNLFRWERWLYRKTDHFLACSKAVADELMLASVPAEKIEVIYNGIDSSQYDSLLSQPKATKLASFIVIIVANLHARKAHQDLLAALASIDRQLPDDWELWCVGHDAGMLASLQQQADDLKIMNHVKWLGRRNDVPQLLVQADVGVLCSHSEGFSNALLEAMLIGLPMVVTDVSGSNEAIVSNESGIIVQPHNSAAISNAIWKLYLDPERRAAYGRQARQRVQTHFSLVRCINSYKNAYQRFLTDSASLNQPSTAED